MTNKKKKAYTEIFSETLPKYLSRDKGNGVGITFHGRTGPNKFVNGKWLPVKMSAAKLAAWNRKKDKEQSVRNEKERIMLKEISLAIHKFDSRGLHNATEVQLLVKFIGGGLFFHRWPTTDLL